MLTVGSLFAGIGGFDLGLERAGMRVAWQSEIDPYASAVLRKHWPAVPNHGDIRSIRAGSVEFVDVICGGFPCQPFSHAGKRGGESDDRYLWPEMLRVIDELRPAYVIGENVAGIINMALDQVLFDLEAIGYTTRPLVIPAVAVDAPHRRDRVWIIALRDRDRESTLSINAEVAGMRGVVANARSGRCGSSEDGQVEQSRRAEAVCTSAVADADDQRSQGREREGVRERADEFAARTTSPPIPNNGCWRSEGARPSVGRRQSKTRWLPEPDVGGGPDGFPLWLDRFVGWGMTHGESNRSVEALRQLWGADVSQALWRHAGKHERLHQAQILFAFVREHAKDPHQARLLMASEEALSEFVRGLWRAASTTSAPRRSGQDEQHADKHSDALQVVSQLPALDGPADWGRGGWEDGIPRVATGIARRVDRLRCLGNAIVPQIAEILGRAIVDAEMRAAV